MKIKQKIYLVVLLISMLFVNLGIYAVFQLTYQKNLETEQFRGETDYAMIRNHIQQDMQAMAVQNRLTDEKITALLQIFEEDYFKQKMKFQLWKNGKQIYPKGSETISYGVEDVKNNIIIKIRGKQREKELVATSELSGFPDVYCLSVSYPLEELNETWNRLYWIYILISFGISLILVLALSITLHFILQPLNQLTKGVADIGNGDYSRRVLVRGSDELSELGENINTMAETIEKNIESLQNENRKKEELVQNLAHEMKSPLTSIYGYAEHLMKSKVGEEARTECCCVIMEESDRMKEMCYTLMDLSEIRKDKEIEFEWIETGKLIANVKKTIDKRQSEILGIKPIEVVFDNKTKKEQKLFGNRNLLEILLLNLVANAIQACLQKIESEERHTIESEVLMRSKVTVQIEMIPETERGYFIRVRDNGTGIPQEKLAHITEPFYRVDMGRSREQGGNGLGLALCRQIIERHQGKMEFYSEPGEGTSVELFLFYQSNSGTNQ